MLLSADAVKRWLYATAADALELQKRAPDVAIKIVDRKFVGSPTNAMCLDVT
jgi:hypothetical protein